MEFNVDVEEMEKQRYKAIKEKGEYIEVDILIGTDNDELDGHIGKIPVVNLKLHDCGAKEIGCMYLTLQSLIEQFEEEFPVECALGKLSMNSHIIGDIDMKHKEEE